MDYQPVPPEQIPQRLAPDPRWGPWAVAPKFVVLGDGSVRCSGVSIEWSPMMRAGDAGWMAADLDPDVTVPMELYSPHGAPTPDELSATVIRSIPFTTVIDLVRRSLPMHEGLARALDLYAHSVVGGEAPPRRDYISDPIRRRRRHLPPDHFERVAQVYRAARSKPRQAVAKAFHCEPVTASGYIRECRSRGLLPETTRGKAAR